VGTLFTCGVVCCLVLIWLNEGHHSHACGHTMHLECLHEMDRHTKWVALLTWKEGFECHFSLKCCKNECASLFASWAMQKICLMANIKAFGKCVLFGFWISKFVCFRSGYCLCFDLIPDLKVERWRINSLATMVEETPNCDSEVFVVSILKLCNSFRCC
jgi:hypothetical protein